MHILFDFYNASKNQTGIPEQRDSDALKDIDKNDYDFNLLYLVKNRSLDGRTLHRWGGQEVAAITGGISAKGIDIVERFVDEGTEHTISAGHMVLKKSLSYPERIMELLTIWGENTELFQQILESLSYLII